MCAYEKKKSKGTKKQQKFQNICNNSNSSSSSLKQDSVAILVRMTVSVKKELIPSSILSSKSANSRNDIQ